MEKFADKSCAIPLMAQTTGAPVSIFGLGSFNAQGFSLFRIFLGLILIYDLIFNIAPYYDLFFGLNGLLTAQERHSDIIWSILSYTDSPIVCFLFFILYPIAIFSFLLGYRARLASFILFICFSSINDRFPPANSNADILISLLLLWASFLPIDRYWSIDAALRDQPDRRTKWPSIPLAAIKIQIGMIYLFSGLFKLSSNQWLSGEALKKVTLDEFYGTLRSYDLLYHLPDDFTKWACIGITLFQIFFSVFIYFPFHNNFFRACTLVAAFLMHACFIFLLQVHLFPYICFAYLMMLVPDRWVDCLLRKRRAKLNRIKIFYDPDCNFCKSVSLIFREFCLPSSVAVRPAAENEEAFDLLKKNTSWVVFGHDEKIYMKWDAVNYVLKQSPVFYIWGRLGELKVFKKATERLYDFIGRNRHNFGKTFGFILKPRAETYPDITAQLICAVLILTSLFYSILTLPQSKIAPPVKLDIAVHQLAIAQKWDLFAPQIASAQFKLKIYGVDKDNSYLDLSQYTDRQFKIDDGYFTFANHRLLRYYREIFPINNPRHRMGVARYLCSVSAKAANPATRIFIEFSSTGGPLVGATPETVKVDYFCSDILNKQN